MNDLELLNVEIRPHRSLSDRGFIILISIITAIHCVTAAVFLSMGATLVPFFLGLDVLAIIVAFAVSFASARRRPPAGGSWSGRVRPPSPTCPPRPRTTGSWTCVCRFRGATSRSDAPLDPRPARS